MPRGQAETGRSTVDYLYWQSLTLHVDNILENGGVQSPRQTSHKALRRLSLTLLVLPFRIVESAECCLPGHQHHLLLHVIHYLIIKKYETGPCHWNKSLQLFNWLGQKINPDFSPLPSRCHPRGSMWRASSLGISYPPGCGYVNSLPRGYTHEDAKNADSPSNHLQLDHR